VLPLDGDLIVAAVGKLLCWIEVRFVFHNDWGRETNLG
jgi:hypothetical protein